MALNIDAAEAIPDNMRSLSPPYIGSGSESSISSSSSNNNSSRSSRSSSGSESSISIISSSIAV